MVIELPATKVLTTVALCPRQSSRGGGADNGGGAATQAAEDLRAAHAALPAEGRREEDRIGQDGGRM
jgi:hypothetical protein